MPHNYPSTYDYHSNDGAGTLLVTLADSSTHTFNGVEKFTVVNGVLVISIGGHSGAVFAEGMWSGAVWAESGGATAP